MTRHDVPEVREGGRQHVMSEDCWCGPHVEEVRTGGQVVVRQSVVHDDERNSV